MDGLSQKIVDWMIDVFGIDCVIIYKDVFDNVVYMVFCSGFVEDVEIIVFGIVDIIDINGVWGKECGVGVLMCIFICVMEVICVNQVICKLVVFVDIDDKIVGFYVFMYVVWDKVDYKVGVMEIYVSVILVFVVGEGVCQDYVYIFIVVVCFIGVFVWYVFGYLLLEDEQVFEVYYVWVEVFVLGFGWVGFDVFNVMCFIDCFICLMMGLDF